MSTQENVVSLSDDLTEDPGLCRYDVRWIDDDGLTVYIYHHIVPDGEVVEVEPPLNNGLYQTDGLTFKSVADSVKAPFVNVVMPVKKVNGVLV